MIVLDDGRELLEVGLHNMMCPLVPLGNYLKAVIGTVLAPWHYTVLFPRHTSILLSRGKVFSFEL
jgi:hypothetical protein